MERLKTCTKCKETKPFSAFTDTKWPYKDGKLSQCRKCLNEYTKENSKFHRTVRRQKILAGRSCKICGGPLMTLKEKSCINCKGAVRLLYEREAAYKAKSKVRKAEWYNANKEQIRARQRKYKENLIRLYDLKKGSKIKVEASDGSKYVIFDHVDGMYSYCTTEKGGILHLAAYTLLYKKGRSYIISNNKLYA